MNGWWSWSLSLRAVEGDGGGRERKRERRLLFCADSERGGGGKWFINHGEDV